MLELPQLGLPFGVSESWKMVGVYPEPERQGHSDTDGDFRKSDRDSKNRSISKIIILPFRSVPLAPARLFGFNRSPV